MHEPEVALVFSPESWVEGLHRHLTDHGGARVRNVVMDPALALEEEYGTLIVSHRWPGLTRAFVDALHTNHRRLLGVYDRGEPAGRDHLFALGVDRVIESDAPMSGFLDALIAMAPGESGPRISDTELREVVEGPKSPTSNGETGSVIGIGGPPGGGATEVSIALALCAAEEVVLVDADDVAPAIAQRLALAIEPNIRTAVDAVEYGVGEISSALVPAPRGAFRVLGGIPNVAAWSQIRPHEVVDVLDAVAAMASLVIANVGCRLEDLAVGVGRTRYGITRAVLERADQLVGVGRGTPVGVTRLLGWVADTRMLTDASLHLVINESPNDGFRRAEIADEIQRTYPPSTLSFVPHDPKIDVAAWSGDLVAPGPFMRAIADVSLMLIGPDSRPSRRNGAPRSSGPRGRTR